MSHIAERLQAVRSALRDAAAKAQRNWQDIDLLAVSKTFPSEAISEAVAAGQLRFGENYVQEALPKIEALRDVAGIEWHMIGPLQSNKTALVARHFAFVHSVERERIAARLSAARPDALPPLSVCVQVNISGEATKSGVAPGAALELCRAVAVLPRLRLRGLMGIADPDADEPTIRAQFRSLRLLLEAARGGGLAVDTLSMGMSADFEPAIAEGATMVRIGSAIFGPREKRMAEEAT
jgi:pyridoxal phosphate enzyme (YggS family)